MKIPGRRSTDLIPVNLWSDHRLIRATVLLACCLATTPLSAAERSYGLGKTGWSLERFGSDVAILRTNVGGSSADEVGLLLACSASDRRIRLLFPDSVAFGHAGGGKALLMAAGRARPRDFVVVNFEVNNGSLVVVTRAEAADDPVAILAKLLAGPAHVIDLIVSWGAGPVRLTNLDVASLVPKGEPLDRRIVDDFLVACRRPPAQQAG